MEVGGNVFSSRFMSPKWRPCIQNFRLALGQQQQARDIGKAIGRIGLYQFQEYRPAGSHAANSWRLVSWHPDMLRQADAATQEKVRLAFAILHKCSMLAKFPYCADVSTP